MRKLTPTDKDHGFTIVELLLATLIFSTVLMLVTMGIMQVTRVYYKGVTESNTQNVARSLVDTVSQAIQFDGGIITAATGSSPTYLCINDQQFAFWLGKQLVDTAPTGNQTNKALLQHTVAGCAAPGPGVTGRELLSPHMRLSNFTIIQVAGASNLYQVHVRVVYGDDDLLNNPTATTAACKNIRAGTQFCAVSDLTAVVQKRVK